MYKIMKGGLYMINNGYRSKQNIYALIKNMSDNMDKLFSNLGIEGGKSYLETSNVLIYFLECVINNGSVLKNIELLNIRLKKAIKKSEDDQLENWNNSKSLEELNNEIQILNSEKFKLQSEIKQIKKIKEQYEKECINLKNELNAVEEKYKNENKTLIKQNMDIVMSIIAFRDSIIMREGLAEGQSENKLKSLLTSLLKETANILNNSHVSILDEKGKFDSSKHIVIDVQQTEDKELHDMVAQVFRPGYKVEDEMIRPEEVILYAYSLN